MLTTIKKRWQLKEKARSLRKLGWTYPEIQNKVFVHKVTLSKWCRDIKLTSEQIKVRGGRYANSLKGAKANYYKRQKEIEKIQQAATKEVHSLSPYEFKLAGVALYWGEGAKKHLTFSNSNPILIRFMMKWFRKVCYVSNKKIKACLYLHTGQDEERMKRYWSKITQIPLEKFSKTVFKQEGSASRKYDRDRYKGTIKIQVFDEDLKHKIIAWIEQLTKFA